MTYQQERDEFISKATKEGIDLRTAQKLMRYASTLQRLAVAQCNGDYPYNGDRDRPEPNNAHRLRWDARYTVCPNCEASGVAKSNMRYSSQQLTVENGPEERLKICPDCRTQELVKALLEECTLSCYSPESSEPQWYAKAIFGGDPRGAVLRLATPNFPYSDDGRAGYGLYVPARRF